MSRLPAPARERWQPLRLGLVDLFYYDQEEFAFRDGGLLLRGNNGTGKSKVLALTLPFLLDGDLSAHRVEPTQTRTSGWSGTCCSAASTPTTSGSAMRGSSSGGLGTRVPRSARSGAG